MSCVRLSAVGLIGLVGAVTSHAGLVQTSRTNGSLLVGSCASDTALVLGGRGIQPFSRAASGAVVRADSQSDRAPAVPALPGSGSLALLGLSSLGFWQFGRAAQKLHWGVAPDWYHTGAPTQVGHVTLFELDAGPLVACDFDQLLHQPLLVRLIRQSQREHHLAQFIPHAAVPRGPPILR